MNLQNIRWPVVFAAMTVALGLLFGGGLVVKDRTVNGPLAALYEASPAVERYAIEEQSAGYVITLKLDEAADLAGAYGELASETDRLLGGAAYEIRLEDERTPALEETQRRVNLYVQEALATGQFAAMAERVAAEAAQAGQTAEMTVDSERVYVEIRSEDGYLLSITERPEAQLWLRQQTAERRSGW